MSHSGCRCIPSNTGMHTAHLFHNCHNLSLEVTTCYSVQQYEVVLQCVSSIDYYKSNKYGLLKYYFLVGCNPRRCTYEYYQELYSIYAENHWRRYQLYLFVTLKATLYLFDLFGYSVPITSDFGLIFLVHILLSLEVLLRSPDCEKFTW